MVCCRALVLVGAVCIRFVRSLSRRVSALVVCLGVHIDFELSECDDLSLCQNGDLCGISWKEWCRSP